MYTLCQYVIPVLQKNSVLASWCMLGGGEGRIDARQSGKSHPAPPPTSSVHPARTCTLSFVEYLQALFFKFSKNIKPGNGGNDKILSERVRLGRMGKKVWLSVVAHGSQAKYFPARPSHSVNSYILTITIYSLTTMYMIFNHGVLENSFLISVFKVLKWSITIMLMSTSLK